MNAAIKRFAARWLPPVIQDKLRNGRSAVPAIPGASFDLPKRTLEDLFQGAFSSNVIMPMSQWKRTRDMVLPLPDYLAIGAIVQTLKPQRVMEIGTYNGSTTLLMAMNGPPEMEIFTLDLPPDEVPESMQGRYQAGSEFKNTAYANGIHQLYGRSETFDFSTYHNSIDLVYIDALHTYEAVKKDTETAFLLLRPGGVILWDDYLWESCFPECAGVTQAVNELSNKTPLYLIAGTRLATHRSAPG